MVGLLLPHTVDPLWTQRGGHQAASALQPWPGLLHWPGTVWPQLAWLLSPPPAFSDAAFLARAKARADAEYYTAEKAAASNKVSGSPARPWAEERVASVPDLCLPEGGRSLLIQPPFQEAPWVGAANLSFKHKIHQAAEMPQLL